MIFAFAPIVALLLGIRVVNGTRGWYEATDSRCVS
jgi:hypothetical protein